MGEILPHVRFWPKSNNLGNSVSKPHLAQPTNLGPDEAKIQN